MTSSPANAARDRRYRDHVARRIEDTERELAATGFDRLLIHSGHSRPRFQDDYHGPFRAHPHFVSWLPLPRHADCLLEVRAGFRPKLWWVSPRDFWHAPPSAPESWWADCYEIESLDAAEAWQHTLAEPLATALLGDPADFASLGQHAALNPSHLLQRLNECRTVKTAWEIECMAEANRVAVAGHRAAAAAFEAGDSELDIHLAYLAAARHDPDTLPYNSIVGLNQHAAVLHYQFRESTAPSARRSFLIDAGADVHGYAADITRTHSAEPGLFADLIDAVERMQLRLCARMQVGRSYVDLHREAHRGVAEILRDSGLCRMPLDAMLEVSVSGSFLPHGLGHFLGVQVHDVAGRLAPDGRDLPPPADSPFLRLTRELEAGNVLTVEPGLYFIPQLLDELRASPLAGQFDWGAIDALIPFGGIRIEDNVVVALETPRNLTREAFAGG
jgi:Xaa-Pro dipeptidase